MATFEVTRTTKRLSAEAAWGILTDWPRHAAHIPFTTVTVTSPVQAPAGVGTVFVARTSIGPLGFDDPMQVTYWRPPTADSEGVCRIVKRGRVVTGWAVLIVTPNQPDPTANEHSPGGGQRGATVRWFEQAQFRTAGPLLNWPNALAGRFVFGHLVDKLLEEA